MMSPSFIQDHLTQLEAYVREVSDRVRGVRAEQSYQRIREIEFRDTSELTNSRVVPNINIYWKTFFFF